MAALAIAILWSICMMINFCMIIIALKWKSKDRFFGDPTAGAEANELAALIICGPFGTLLIAFIVMCYAIAIPYVYISGFITTILERVMKK